MVPRKILRVLFVFIIALMAIHLFNWYSLNNVEFSMLTNFTPGDWVNLLKTSFFSVYNTCPILIYAFILLSIIRSII